MAIYLFSQILKFTKYRIKLIEKLSRRHLINSSDVFIIKGFTVRKKIITKIVLFAQKKNISQPVFERFLPHEFFLYFFLFLAPIILKILIKFFFLNLYLKLVYKTFSKITQLIIDVIAPSWIHKFQFSSFY